MHISMFSSWQVRCGIASYTEHLVNGLRTLDDTEISVVPFDRKPHARSEYIHWGRMLNAGDVAHVQHEYAFFDYRLPWRHHFPAFIAQVRKPLVITRHVSFDGPLNVPGQGLRHSVHQFKWSLYNHWLGPYAAYLNRGIFERAQQVIVLSARIKNQLVARGMCAEKIHVIPAGVPEVKQASGGEHLRVKWDWSDKKVLGVFGYITPAKGQLVAVDALARLPEQYVLLIAGGLRREADRETLKTIERRIAQLKLHQRVRITGYVDEDDVPAHMDACDVLLYPATHVDSSYSVVTGLSYRSAPLIVSDVYGHREVAERCAALALFPSGDADALARTVQNVLDAPERRALMLRAAEQYAHGYSWYAIAKRTREVYAQAMTVASRNHSLN